MLKATELRVGNFIFTAPMTIRRVDGVIEKNGEGFAIIDGWETPLKLLTGIRIDAMILDACDLRYTRTSNVEHISYGFTTTTEEYGLYDDELNEYFKVTITTNSKDGRTAINCSNKTGIKYLHELQNAYWLANSVEMPFDFNVYAKFFVSK